MTVTQAARSDAMRQRILDAAFPEIYRNGFQAASLNAIAAAAGVSKGALFHHFAGKQALGYALLDEVVARFLRDRWLAPLAQTADPLSDIQACFRRNIGEDVASGSVPLGCPLNNLAQEMSPLDEGFRTRIDRLYTAWRHDVAQALERGQRAGTVRGDADPRGVATLVVLSQMGIWGTGKSSQDPVLMTQAGEALCAYLEALRP
jgi:TetR/AcrR family transcriptional regulator, transcriptional repressor for nem operon